MTYSSYIAGGIYGALRKGSPVTLPNSQNTIIYKKKMGNCLDCNEVIAGGKRQKRCVTCSDIYNNKVRNIYRKKSYILSTKNHKYIKSSKYSNL